MKKRKGINMKGKFMMAAAGATLLVTGCTSVGVTPVNSFSAKPANCQLDIYASEAEIQRPFQTACLINSRTGTTAFHRKNAAAAIDHARSEACGCGADAMLIQATDTQGVTMTTWGQGKAIIQAIRYTD
ncbi:hypothetical protein [Billgrantia endophytica]|uniref:Lipoprotein n=1 Tax=Billgrantia endophytica TaxID=2033802 RepID=A0A2N7TV62_9GAMM|nr:hypothetical protein [Halomonas endophytica]PMR72079.1 hypothetical protein C1H69_22105 [Halomonas endophytica]